MRIRTLKAIAYAVILSLITGSMIPMDLHAEEADQEVYDEACKETGQTVYDAPGEETVQAEYDAAGEEVPEIEQETYIADETADDPAYEADGGYHEIDFDIEQVNFEKVSEGDGVSPDLGSDDILVEEMPSQYRNPELPALRRQTPYNNCWAYSSIALAEINLIRKDPSIKDSINLSELQCSYFTYNPVTDPLGGTTGDINRKSGSKGPLQVGGNLAFSTNVLASWIGAADADDVSGNTENSYGGVSASSLDKGVSPGNEYAYDHDTYHLTGYYIADYDIDKLDIIKSMIMDYGAVSMSIYAKGSSSNNYNGYYNSENNAFYGTSTSSNHAVTIVGWDDEFPASNFNTAPKGDGAWLVRNSWSTETYEEAFNGYFWLSYYNGTLIKTGTKQKVYAFEFEGAGACDNNYQYDGSMYPADSGITSGANVFTAHANESGAERLTAVSFATTGADAHYRISIYTGLAEDGAPDDGSLAATLEGDTTYAGYYTVPIGDTEIIMEEGERFSVAVELSDTSKGIMSEYTSSASWYDITGRKDAGTSYVLKNNKWTDFSTGEYAKDNWSKYGNFRIKAFTDNINCVLFDTCADDAKLPDGALRIEYGCRFGKYGNLPVPVRKGYDFAGWNTVRDGSGDFITEDSVVDSEGSIALFARWTIHKYAVSFESNGGSEIPLQEVEYRSRAVEPAEPPLKEGQVFTGWYRDEKIDVPYDFEDEVVSDITLYAGWALRVRFDACGGEFASDPVKDVYIGRTYGILPLPYRNGYDFAGWYDGPDDDAMIVSPITVVADKPECLLYARWVENTGQNESQTALKSITLNVTAATIAVGERMSINAVTNPSTSAGDISWSVNDQSLVTEETYGRTVTFTAVKSGTLTVTASCGGKKAVCKVKIVAPQTEVSSGSPLKLSAKNAYVAEGKNLTLTARYWGTKIANTSLDWIAESVDGYGQAAVNNKGVLMAVSEGRVKVYAVNPLTGLKSDGLTVDIYVPVKKSSLSLKSAVLPEGEELSLSVNITPKSVRTGYATGSAPGINIADEISWSLKKSSDSSFVSIDEHGTVKALAATSYTVPVTASFTPYGARKATVLTCKVKIASKPMSGIRFGTKKLLLDIGDETDIPVLTTPSVPYVPDLSTITCTADNDNITAEYDDDRRVCHVTGLKMGSSVITVHAGNWTAKCNVTVGEEPDHIVLNKSGKQLLGVNKSVTVKGTVYTGSNAKYRSQSLVWKTDDPGVVYVNSSGKVTAISPGVTTLTAYVPKHPEISKSLIIETYVPVTSLKADRKTFTMTAGDSPSSYEALTVSVLPQKASVVPAKITYTISGNGKAGFTAVNTESLMTISSSAGKKNYLRSLVYSDQVSTLTLDASDSLAIQAISPGNVKITAQITDVAGKTVKTTCSLKIK